MEKEKLNSWMLLCTLNDIEVEIDYNDIINNFAMTKARRKSLLYMYYDNRSDLLKNKDVEWKGNPSQSKTGKVRTDGGGCSGNSGEGLTI
ncbi:hypothetical protein TNCV_211341 [Trichonephila clavipes]|uniref:Uncharacterized protein n=1 Tax=Trichonephila clavipes TaxID=2585209 RepID=A0A8X6T3D8_TRICX|nr:hypothetical protein TNCV_211341 [Trichonephila clavipes]